MNDGRSTCRYHYTPRRRPPRTAPTMPDSTRTPRPDLALFLLRLIVGAVFLAHGALKLFSFGYGGTVGFFTQLHIPLPNVAAAVVIAVETLGGLALVFGAGVRLAAPLLAVDMLGAIVFAKL